MFEKFRSLSAHAPFNWGYSQLSLQVGCWLERCLSRAIQSAVILAEGGDQDGDLSRTAFMTAIGGRLSGSPAFAEDDAKLRPLVNQESVIAIN